MTVKAYRLVKSKRANHAFDGEGARLYGGRWNSPGQSCVYLASSASLAILEIMVHLDDYTLLKHYHLYEIVFNNNHLLKFDTAELPANWRNDPAPYILKTMGDNWLNQHASLGLIIPSAILPIENNILINPNHIQMSTIEHSIKQLEFNPDSRL
ncbi:MAG: RES family NAD+ phosphorylase [bacterium]